MEGLCRELPSKIGVDFITGIKEYEPYSPTVIQQTYMLRLLSFKSSKSFKEGFKSLNAALRVLTICEVPVDSEWAESVKTNTDKFDALWIKLKAWEKEIEDAENEDNNKSEQNEEQEDEDDEDKEPLDDDNEDEADDDDNEDEDFHECTSSGDKRKCYFIPLVVFVFLNLIRILTFLSFRCLLYY